MIKRARSTGVKKVAALSIAIIEFILLYVFLTRGAWLGVGVQAFVCIASLLIAGIWITKLMSFPGGFGFYIAGSEHGIGLVERLAESHKGFWDTMPGWGLVLGFGLISYPLFKKRISKKVFAFGILSIIVLQLLVLPYLAYALQFLNIPGISAGALPLQAGIITTEIANLTGLSYFSLFFLAVTIVFGFSGYIFLAIWLNGGSILVSVVESVKSSIASGSVQTSAVASQIPGVEPVIPGIDVPLLAGIISLAIILAVHEVSHGILASRVKIKLKAIGLIVFGVIPVGAFVEPDEKMLEKATVDKKTRVLAAGVSANFILTFIFFVLMMFVFINFINGHYIQQVFINGTTAGYPAYNAIPINSQVLFWNGYPIKSIQNLTLASRNDTPGSVVSIVTNTGNYSFIAKASPTNSSKGLVGVFLQAKEVPISNGLGFRIDYFLFSLFALSFLLNFAVAVVNLMPIPMFDGWHIYKANVKRMWITKTLAVILIVGIVLNALPLIVRI
jgi:membrane-associated protease RseP (regulator of RpoE activity)